MEEENLELENEPMEVEGSVDHVDHVERQAIEAMRGHYVSETNPALI